MFVMDRGEALGIYHMVWYDTSIAIALPMFFKAPADRMGWC
ncbi:hypothetical protein B0G57_10115 [Trinickia symbiotica]|nr:hypothetical protein B0G57_10115 [Trinickia symbiotica]